MERQAVFQQGLEATGIALSPELIVMAGYLHEHGFAATDALLTRRPSFTASVCVNGLTALGAIECVQHRGARVPDDVSVTDYDDTLIPRYGAPPYGVMGR